MTSPKSEDSVPTESSLLARELAVAKREARVAAKSGLISGCFLGSVVTVLVCIALGVLLVEAGWQLRLEPPRNSTQRVSA